MDQLKYTMIWQQNVNKSCISQHNLISSNYLVSKQVSTLALQELTIDNDGYTLTSREWVAIYPTLHWKPNTSTRVVTLIRVSLNPDMWERVNFLSTDIVVIQLHGEWGKVTIVNVYNDCNNDDTIHLLTEFHNRN